MEVLGFTETPATVYDARLTWVETEIAPPEKAEPADDFISSWLPAEIGAIFSNRRIRWGMVGSLGMLLLIVAIAAVWVYQRPAAEMAQAREGVVTAMTTLSPGLAELREANATLDSPNLDGARASSATLAVDTGVRQLFDAAARLTDTDSDVRTRIIALSGSVAEAMRRFSDAVAVRSAVVPALGAPDLLVDPGMISLEDAAAAFADWQARYETLRESLPEVTFQEVSEAMAALSANLTGHQRLYLDALAEGDSATASAVVDRIGTDLSDIEARLMSSLTATKEEVDQAVAAAEEELEEILALLR